MNISDKALYIYDDYENELLYILLFNSHEEVEEAVNWWSKWYEGVEEIRELPYADKRDILLSKFNCKWVHVADGYHERLYF